MLKVVFCGTPDIAVPTLKALHNDPSVEIVSVVSQPDRPSGRGNQFKSPEVIIAAKELKIPTFQCENINRESDFLTMLEQNPPDLFIVFAFAQFLGKRVLNLSKLGCFNIHTSILPRHRGAAPIHYAIWCGDTISGVSIQRMVKQMDAGDLCHKATIPVADNETTPQLYERLKLLASEQISPFIKKLNEQSLVFTAQEPELITFAPTIKKEEGFVDPTLLAADEIDKRVRAFLPWPGVQLMFDNKRCKILKALTTTASCPTGKLCQKEEALLLGCAQSSTLQIQELQIEGKAATDAKAWLNGQRGQLPQVTPLTRK